MGSENGTVITGLNEEEVERRYREGKYNKPVASPSKSVKQIILSNLFTYFNLIFFIIAAAIMLVGEFKHLTFLAVIIVNTVIGIIQEINSKRTLDKLSLLSAPSASVLRGTRVVNIPVEDVVLDDIAVFGAGNQIYADAKVISGSVNVNESLVTGESDEITKNVGEDLLSGSFAVSGKCFARITAVGEDSFASKLTLDAKKMKKKTRAGMMKSLTRLVQFIGVAIIPLACMMMYNEIHTYQSGISDAVVNTSAALLGMIPEGLYLLTSVALAVSVMRLAKKRTLVHELGCIEALARVDTLCVDKTGTITEPKMNVSSVICVNNMYSDDAINDTITSVIGNLEPDNDTMEALYEYFVPENVPAADKVVPFSSSIKYSGAGFSGNGSYVIGAPEFILSDRYGEYRSLVEKYTQGGARVLLFASYSRALDGGPLLSGAVTPVALILLMNRVRENARETFNYFQTNGVNVKVISGDDPVTASGAAMEAGIIGAENYISARELKDEKAIEEAVKRYTVFGRVTPEQKRSLVRALKKQGHTVAMTGDGVNDVLALKEADCSVAMASGSDVASQVSDLVLLDSDFAAMPSVVAEGRRVINNIERSATLFLVKNIFSFVLSLISILAVFEYPISPANLTIINTVTIGIPSFILALEPNTEPVKGKFLRNVLYRAAPAAMSSLFCVIFAVLFKSAYNISDKEIATVCTVLMGTVGMIMLFYVCRPFNWIRRLLVILMAALFVLGLTLLPLLFDIAPLSFGSVLIMVLLMLLAPSLMIVFRWIMEKISYIYRRITLRNGIKRV